MLYNTEAVVIKSITYGENNAIITLLTPNGSVSAMARGAKKPQSRLVAAIQPCVQGLYSIWQNTGMGTIRQFELINTRRVLRESLDMAAYAAYFCELAGVVAEPRPGGSEALYRLFLGALDTLLREDLEPFIVARIWEAKVLRILGTSPPWQKCVSCGDNLHEPAYSFHDGGFICAGCVASQTMGTSLRVQSTIPIVMEQMSQVPWSKLGRVKLSDAAKSAIDTVLRNQMSEFAGLSLKSRGVLESLGLS